MNESNIYDHTNDENEEPEEVTRLKPVFARLTMEMIRIEKEVTDEGERREALEANSKEFKRAAFMSNKLATEADFERLWPRIRDDVMCEHADIIFRQTMAALTREYDEGKSPHDYLEEE